MRWRLFFKLLVQVTIACLIWAFGVAGIVGKTSTIVVYLLSISSFVTFSILVFAWSRRIVDRGKMYTFSGVVSLSFLVKLVMAIASIWLYEHYVAIEDSFHLLHYILIYIVYTVFEVYFLTELGKEG